MGFSDAVDVQPGDFVTVRGVPQEVRAVMCFGRDWPYYQLKADVQTEFGSAGPDWVSWQQCGPVVKAVA